jgi:putative phosphoesterase
VRVAVVSDVHGSLAALESVAADVRRAAPDLVVHGGDCAAIGPRPAEVVDRLRELGWPGVAGNTDELLWDPSVRAEQERRAPRLRAWLDVLFGTLGPWAAERLGDERIAWLRAQPHEWRAGGVRVVHATPDDLWRAPMPGAPGPELAAVYGGPGVRAAVYGHVHRPYARGLAGLTVANSGSAALPWDGDPRASYVLVDGGVAEVRRVAFEPEPLRRELAGSGFPLPDWLAAVRERARFEPPA